MEEEENTRGQEEEKIQEKENVRKQEENWNWTELPISKNRRFTQGFWVVFIESEDECRGVKFWLGRLK